MVSKAKSGRKLSLVLCTDILVLIDNGSLYRMVSATFRWCTLSQVFRGDVAVGLGQEIHNADVLVADAAL